MIVIHFHCDALEYIRMVNFNFPQIKFLTLRLCFATKITIVFYAFFFAQKTLFSSKNTTSIPCAFPLIESLRVTLSFQEPRTTGLLCVCVCWRAGGGGGGASAVAARLKKRKSTGIEIDPGRMGNNILHYFL